LEVEQEVIVGAITVIAKARRFARGHGSGAEKNGWAKTGKLDVAVNRCCWQKREKIILRSLE